MCPASAQLPPLALPPRRSNTGSHPPPDHSHNSGDAGDCSFGPDLNFIGVTFTGPICPTW